MLPEPLWPEPDVLPDPEPVVPWLPEPDVLAGNYSIKWLENWLAGRVGLQEA